MIGVLTMVIGDLASHFGCTVGLTDAVTAITFVALGTSLPGELWFRFWWNGGVQLSLLFTTQTPLLVHSRSRTQHGQALIS